jgi:hypothetical protein
MALIYHNHHSATRNLDLGFDIPFFSDDVLFFVLFLLGQFLAESPAQQFVALVIPSAVKDATLLCTLEDYHDHQQYFQ